MKKINVFYVWGYGSSPESSAIEYLKNGLGNQFNVISDYYAQYNPKEAIFDINKYIKEYNIDLIVGSSLGGYLAMQLTNIPKVIINPCVRPDIELPKLTNEVDVPNTDNPEETHKEKVPAVPEHIVNFYTDYISEHNVWENYNENEDKHTVFVMGNNDEVLGNRYLEEVKNHASSVVISEQGHGNTQESINTFVVPEIKKMFNM